MTSIPTQIHHDTRGVTISLILVTSTRGKLGYRTPGSHTPILSIPSAGIPRTNAARWAAIADAIEADLAASEMTIAWPRAVIGGHARAIRGALGTAAGVDA